MTDKLFDTKPADPQPNPNNSGEPNPLLTQLAEIKNDQGQPKYDSMEKALEALSNSQAYIPTLKTDLDTANAELASVKAKLDAVGNVEDIVKSLLPKAEPPQTPPTITEPKGLDEQGVADIVSRTLADNAQKDTARMNEEKVVTALTTKFGEKAKEALAAKAVELSTTVEALGQLATESPDMVISLFNQGSQAPEPSYSSINSAGFQKTPDVGLEPPTKSLLSGATTADQVDYWKQVKANVYKKYDVTT